MSDQSDRERDRRSWNMVLDALGAVRFARGHYGSSSEGAKRVRDVVDNLRTAAENNNQMKNKRFVLGVAQALEDGFL